MKIIILAGSGVRLLPLSHTSYPKQFLLLGHTIDRFLTLVKPSDVVIVTDQDDAHFVKSYLIGLHAEDAHILVEPAARSTAPAITLAVRFCIDQLGCKRNEVMIVTPPTLLIHPLTRFTEDILQAVVIAEFNQIVNLVIKPDSPKIGYSYIKAGQPLGKGFYVDSFRGKPDRATAEAYLAAGGYYWSSGIFAFTITCFLEELLLNQGKLFSLADKSLEKMRANFTKIPNISFDHALIEKSRQVVLLPLSGEYRDIVSCDFVDELPEKETDRDTKRGVI